MGSFECNCQEGFQRNGNKCENINECEVQNPCSSKQHSTCRDNDGSFECECDPGYESDPMVTDPFDGECRVVCPENSERQGSSDNIRIIESYRHMIV